MEEAWGDGQTLEGRIAGDSTIATERRGPRPAGLRPLPALPPAVLPIVLDPHTLLLRQEDRPLGVGH